MDDLSEKDDTGCERLLAAALVVFVVLVGGAWGVYEFIRWAMANGPRGW